MPNVTLAFDEATLKRGKERAKQSGTSFNAYVRNLVARDTQPKDDWLQGLFDLMDENPLDSGGITWKREDLHER